MCDKFQTTIIDDGEGLSEPLVKKINDYMTNLKPISSSESPAIHYLASVLRNCKELAESLGVSVQLKSQENFYTAICFTIKAYKSTELDSFVRPMDDYRSMRLDSLTFDENELSAI